MFRSVHAKCGSCGMLFHHSCPPQQSAGYCFTCGTPTVRDLQSPVGLASYTASNALWKRHAPDAALLPTIADSVDVNVPAAEYGEVFAAHVPLSQALWQLREHWENCPSDWS